MVLSIFQRTDPQQEEVLLRERLQQLAAAQKRLCGYRPLTALLRREGHLVNRKRVLRLLRFGQVFGVAGAAGHSD